MWSLHRPSPRTLDAMLARAATQALTYGDRPGLSDLAEADARAQGYGYEHNEVELDVPFAAARVALAAFATHRLSYLFVHPPDARVVVGQDVVVTARIGPLWTTNPCRIVSLDESPTSFRYAYGTLPGHSESGEESFGVARLDDMRTRAWTTAVARPLDPLARLGKPVAHVVQQRIKIDYIRALRESCLQ